MNKCKAPKIPPVFSGNKFITDGKDKATIFARFLTQQCQPLFNGSTLPPFSHLTHSRIDHVTVGRNYLSLNKGKASGPDNVSSHMLILCDDTVTLPIKIIFEQIVASGIYPNTIHKKGDKQFIKNYRPISSLPICGKLFEKIVVNQIYGYFSNNNLITKNQSGDSTSNQLIELVNEIHKSLDNRYEVRAVFLDISKAFDKVWYEGLLFKLKQNGLSGKMITLLGNYLNDRKQRVVLRLFAN